MTQPNISKEAGLRLMHDFIKNEGRIQDGMEPFPISLRLLFWIKFVVKHKIEESIIDQSIWYQLSCLSAMPEYHLLGNHLLENGFGLLFGGYYFKDEKIIEQAKSILIPQLEEQILEDGAHFELSPMYHQLMLYRMLDCINLMQNNSLTATDADDLLEVFLNKVPKMLGWMNKMAFANGDMPHFNDSIDGIAPKSAALLEYAKRLQIVPETIELKDSGYRKFCIQQYEVVLDVGQIGPSYIPGHAHSDTFSFILYHQQTPFIVDPGISTYEKNAQRNAERATSSHNTVRIANKEQSEVWGGFRVGRRAKIIQLKESENCIKAVHNGYNKIGCHHQRTFLFSASTMLIEDLIIGNKSGVAFLHFHPDVAVSLNNQQLYGDTWEIQFEESTTVNLEPYQFALGFNHTQKALKAVIS
ncbi:MAG: alginate lyase family protein, partial [Bacteroidota bacterium]